jgi:Zn-dependent M28 family amino/carboxypeptidase
VPAFVFMILALWQAAAASAPDSIVEDVRKLSAATDGDARYDAITSVLRTRNLAFTTELFEAGVPIRNEPRTKGRNVVVSIGEGAEEVLVGAHYDAARLSDGSLSPGAVDNAASSVMLVRLAEALRGERLPLRLRLVWFDLEEGGAIGSARYIEAHRGDRFRAMLNFDINGYGDTVIFAMPQGGESPGLQRALIETCAQESVDCVRFSQLPASDDRPFGRAGIPAVSIALQPAADAHQLWLLLHGGQQSGLAPGTVPAVFRTIHTANDVPSKVDGESVARMQRFALALVRRVAAGPLR